MYMRNLWTQTEVIMMGNFLQFVNWDRRGINYWMRKGLFPKPIAQSAYIVLYGDNDIDSAFFNIGKRQRVPIDLTPDDLQMAKRHVLETDKAKNMSMLLEKIRVINHIASCVQCHKVIRVNEKQVCLSCFEDNIKEESNETEN